MAKHAHLFLHLFANSKTMFFWHHSAPGLPGLDGMGKDKVECVLLCYFFFVFGNGENDSPMSVHKASKQVVSVGTEASCVARVLSLLFCVRFLRGTLPGTSFYANS